jgi:valyl-tRNA synthetase
MAEQAPVSTDASTDAAYDPAAIEDKWYRYWEENGFFRADADAAEDPHVVMMPPPNVTGRLHIGHALQDAIQDALTRIRRMQGHEALWMPGLDHAGIATQNVVEEKLREEGTTRHDLGRDAFVERVYAWKEEYGEIILDQKRKLGDSCDWDRQRFTMDEGFTRAVQEVFVRLYEEGLIYRGDYLVNWDPENETALSDEEVDNVEREGHLWYIRYPLKPENGETSTDEHLTIATTRPETMLGDTAIAVSPDDERYQHLIGRTAVLPLLGRELPIIGDEYIDSSFGTGALKVTPAHDENDFEIGERHDLDSITVISPQGTINEHGGPYEGLDRFAAREKVVDDLKAEGLIEKVEDHAHKVPISSRSGAVIEPLISRQWFVEMEPLAEPAIEAVKEGEIQFHPERWANEYFRWMENIRDWCISRQLWWGHRIPVWYYTDENGEPDPEQGYVVSVDQPEEGMVQETDVLDTWFSSWLWPFATLGWPEETDDLEAFYPTDVLVSGYDILFFWIARMIMAGYAFTDEPPFTDVFITGMVKDEQGRWMSKSLGNGIDPIEMVDQYGADATRFTLTLLCAQGQDIKLAPSKFEMGRNFANKIWNAFNVFGQFMERAEDGTPKDYRRRRGFEELDLVEQWMLHRLNTTIAAIEDDLSRYRLNEAVQKIYDVFWHDYCDWYLELIKPPYGEAMDADRIALAVEIYETLIKLLHPFMPFITEELWWKLRPREEGEACIVADWPTVTEEATNEEAAQAFEQIQEMISGIRGIKNDYGVGLGHEIAATVSVPETADEQAATIRRHADYFEKLASVTDLTVEPGAEKPQASASVVVGRSEVFVPLAGMIDLDQERERLRKEIQQKEDFLESVEKKLNNPQFVTKAPDEVVEKERKKKKDATAELERLRDNLDDLQAVG